MGYSPVYPRDMGYWYPYPILTMTTTPNQMREVLLLVCSKMADETNLNFLLHTEHERSEGLNPPSTYTSLNKHEQLYTILYSKYSNRQA